MTATDDVRLVLLAIAIAVTVSYTGIAQGPTWNLWLGGAIATAIVEEELQAWDPSWVKATFILSNLN